MSTYMKVIVFINLALLIVFGWHFATVFGFLGTAPQTQSEFFIRLGVILIAYIASAIITAFMVLRKTGNAPLPDEREEIIELKTERVGVPVLYIGLIVVAWYAFMPLTAIQTANAILAAVCVSELSKICYGLFILKRAL